MFRDCSKVLVAVQRSFSDSIEEVSGDWRGLAGLGFNNYGCRLRFLGLWVETSSNIRWERFDCHDF